jgi:D-beta-D-heptose 7-phosphate kinase / D-beta-D-heptose 1-phosphate adenosyltransferase
VLILGDLMVDEYVIGDCSRISPEAPVPVLQFNNLRTVLGGAANTAANVVSLGGRTTLIGLCGDDQAGEGLAHACDKAGIQLVAVRDGRPTTRKVRVIGQQQQQLLRLDYEDTSAIGAAIERAVLDEVSRAIGEADIVVVSDYAKGLLTKRICQEVFAVAHAAGKEVIVDPRPQHASFYADCDYLTPNWQESRGLLGLSDAAMTDSHVEETGRRLSRQFRSNVLLTLGSHGISFFGKDEGEHFTIPTASKEVYDVSGAGDTVVATFALARAAGTSHLDGVSLANRAAGIVVGKRGTATVTPDELLLPDADFEPRIVTRDELRPLVARLRSAGKRIVTINGSFDLLHAGHLHIIKEAKQQGDVLIVGLNSDASVRMYKGAARPVVPEAERAQMLLALRYVDYVHIFGESVPMPFIEVIRPDVHVNGAEYGENCVEAEVVRNVGARLHLVERIDGLSTSAILQKL